MLNLATTSKVQVVSSAAATLDIYASFVDLAGTTVTPGAQATAMTTASTQDVVAAPGAGVRNVKSLTVRNKGAVSTTVTVHVDVSGTDYEVRKVTLAPGQSLVYDEASILWQVLNELAYGRSVSTADQSVPVALTALTDGILDAVGLKAKTILRWRVLMSKTGAGIAAQTFEVKFGTAGSTADTTRLTGFTTGTQTGAIDTAEVFIVAQVRSVGAGGIVHGKMNLTHNLAATGFATIPNVVQQVVSTGFDNTVAGLKATLCTTPGASAVVTVHEVEAERLDP